MKGRKGTRRRLARGADVGPSFHWAKNSPEEDKLVDCDEVGERDLQQGRRQGRFSWPLRARKRDVHVLFQWAERTVKGTKENRQVSQTDFFKEAIPIKAQFHYLQTSGAIDGYVVAERTISGDAKGAAGEPLPAIEQGRDDARPPTSCSRTPRASSKHGWAFGNAAEMAPAAPPPPPAEGAAAPATKPGRAPRRRRRPAGGAHHSCDGRRPQRKVGGRWDPPAQASASSVGFDGKRCSKLDVTLWRSL